MLNFVHADPESGRETSPRQISVLVVEDDFGDYDNIARALRKMRCFSATFTRARTLESARAALAEVNFDVLLIDYNLGSESGARLLKEIGGRTGRGVAVLLTGLLDDHVHHIALEAGATCCIAKNDLSPTLLETTIRTALYTHRLEAEVSALLQTLARGTQGTERLGEFLASHPESARLLAQAAKT